MSQNESAILVTGGAGYIGAHTVRLLASQTRPVVVLDNLVYGHREAILSPDVVFVEGQVGDREVVERLFQEHSIDAVVHFAAYAYVGESVENPAKYYSNNTAQPLILLDACRQHGCEKFVFSSTCATYGKPVSIPITEGHPQAPINPYGQSKLMLEHILRDFDTAYGLRSVSLRYFNVCGAAEDGAIGEDHDPETHLIPLVLLAAAGEIDEITVFGTDYDTPDGTCIRDYIHVEDLARAHLSALEYLDGGGSTTACNLGTGRGVSVQEIIGIAEEVTGRTVPVVLGKRRPGDPPRLVADPSFARKLFGWEAEHTEVRDAIRSAWNWITGPRKGRFRSAS